MGIATPPIIPLRDGDSEQRDTRLEGLVQARGLSSAIWNHQLFLQAMSGTTECLKSVHRKKYFERRSA